MLFIAAQGSSSSSPPSKNSSSLDSILDPPVLTLATTYYFLGPIFSSRSSRSSKSFLATASFFTAIGRGGICYLCIFACLGFSGCIRSSRSSSKAADAFFSSSIIGGLGFIPIAGTEMLFAGLAAPTAILYGFYC